MASGMDAVRARQVCESWVKSNDWTWLASAIRALLAENEQQKAGIELGRQGRAMVAEVARLTAEVAYEQERNANNVAQYSEQVASLTAEVERQLGIEKAAREYLDLSDSGWGGGGNHVQELVLAIGRLREALRPAAPEPER